MNGEYGTKCDFCGREYDDMGNDIAVSFEGKDWCGHCSLEGKYDMSAEEMLKLYDLYMQDYWKYIRDKPQAAHLRVMWMESLIRMYRSANGFKPS